MPQKVNPDALEVIKGKAADVTSRLSGLLSLGRASLSGYNRDQQWSKYLIMEACLEAMPAVSIMARMVDTSCRPETTHPLLHRRIGVDTARLRDMAATGFAGVTELMEQLVAQTGIEFRHLKRVMEHAVALSLHQGSADTVTHEALSQALQAAGFDIDLDAATTRRLQDPVVILAHTQVVGGPGRDALQAELAQLSAVVEAQRQIWQRREAVLHARYEACGKP